MLHHEEPAMNETKESIQLYCWLTPTSWKVSIMLGEFALPYDPPTVDIG
jgi:glutathione S-transferase